MSHEMVRGAVFCFFCAWYEHNIITNCATALARLHRVVLFQESPAAFSLTANNQ